jgi:rhomboid protease GluP
MSNDPRFPLPPFPGSGDQPRAHVVASPINVFRHDLFTATPRVFITHLIVAANALVFILMVVTGRGGFLEPNTQQMLRWGAGWGPLTTHGQPWRLFTEMFVHFGIIHIGMNMYVLWQGGRLIERLFGNFPYLVIYIFSGLVGSFLSLYAHPLSLTAGASGAVFGVYGALLGYLAVQRVTIPPPILNSLFRSAGLFVVYNLAFGFALRNVVDMYAHGGGLVGGAVLGALLSRKLVRNANLVRAIAVAVIGSAIVLYLFGHLHPIPLPGQTDQSSLSRFTPRL